MKASKQANGKITSKLENEKQADIIQKTQTKNEASKKERSERVTM